MRSAWLNHSMGLGDCSYWDRGRPRPPQAAGSLTARLELVTLSEWISTKAGEGARGPIKSGPGSSGGW